MDKELLEAFRADNLAAHAALDKIGVPHPAAKLAIRVPIAAAELAALRDENARLREACEKALAIIDEQAPALTGWRARDVMAALRAALEVTK